MAGPDLEKTSLASAGLDPQAATLRDGTLVNIRPIRPDDAPRLQALAVRLSPESIYLRFLTHRTTLSDEEARRLASVDYHSHMAFVATPGQADDADIIAVARYAGLGPAEPGVAEAGVIVEDRYQGRGLATLLLARLVAYARAHGIRSFVATFHPSNAIIMQLIRKSGLVIENKQFEMGLWCMQMSLGTGQTGEAAAPRADDAKSAL